MRLVLYIYIYSAVVPQEWHTSIFGYMDFCSGEDGNQWKQIRQTHCKATPKTKAQELTNHLRCGNWVKLVGLKNTSLNGKLAEIVLDGTPNNVVNTDDFIVRVFKANSKSMNRSTFSNKPINRRNLQALPASEMIKVCRLNAKDGRGVQVETLFWPREVLESAHYTPFEIPVAELLGFPIYITPVEPHSYRMTRVNEKTSPLYDDWDDFMMINRSTGLPPVQWQKGVGTAIIWRRDGDVSAYDMNLLNKFLSNGCMCLSPTDTRTTKDTSTTQQMMRTGIQLALSPRVAEQNIGAVTPDAGSLPKCHPPQGLHPRHKSPRRGLYQQGGRTEGKLLNSILNIESGSQTISTYDSIIV